MYFQSQFSPHIGLIVVATETFKLLVKMEIDDEYFNSMLTLYVYQTVVIEINRIAAWKQRPYYEYYYVLIGIIIKSSLVLSH